MKPISISLGLFLLSIIFLFLNLPILFLGLLFMSSAIIGNFRMVYLMDTQPSPKQIRKENLRLCLLGLSCFICGHFSPILLDLLLSYTGGVLFGLIGVSYFYEKR